MDFKQIRTSISRKIPFFPSLIQSGFPSPADDYIEMGIDLNQSLISHPNATFMARTTGDSMLNAGIFPGSYLIIDRARTPINGDIIVGVLNGEFTVKRFLKDKKGVVTLRPENKAYQDIRITREHEFQIWGVVAYTFRDPNLKQTHIV